MTREAALGRTRDFAISNLAIDCKLRGCDVVSLKVENAAPHRYALERAIARQQKTGRSFRHSSRLYPVSVPSSLVEGLR